MALPTTTGSPAIPPASAITLLLEEDVTDRFHSAFERRGGINHESPAHALAFAVLLNAISQLTSTPRERRYGRRGGAYIEALVWLDSDDYAHPFYFRPICDYLHFDHTLIRRGVRQLLEKNQRVELRFKTHKANAMHISEGYVNWSHWTTARRKHRKKVAPESQTLPSNEVLPTETEDLSS